MSQYELSGVGKAFNRGPRRWSTRVQGVDLEIDAGDHVSIVGRSGSGKTTLLKILGTLDPPRAGPSFEGRDLGAPGPVRSPTCGSNFGFVFQQFNLIATLTALENVDAGLPPGSGPTSGSANCRSPRSRVGLADRPSHKPSRLSGGEQQRVAIARALSSGRA